MSPSPSITFRGQIHLTPTKLVLLDPTRGFLRPPPLPHLYFRLLHIFLFPCLIRCWWCFSVCQWVHVYTGVWTAVGLESADDGCMFLGVSMPCRCCCCSVPQLNIECHPVCAHTLVHEQVQSTGWEDCMCNRFQSARHVGSRTPSSEDLQVLMSVCSSVSADVCLCILDCCGTCRCWWWLYVPQCLVVSVRIY